MREHLVMAFLMIGALTAAGTVHAQSLGTFRWQQEPYCNVITLNVVQHGGVYQLTGFDDECDAPARGAVNGTAFQNPDGSIGMGLLSIHKLLSSASIRCGTEVQGMFFIAVDGVPIRNSVVYAGPAGFSGVLSGVTLNSFPAGSHVLGIGVQCFPGGVPTVVNANALTISSVIVLP